LRRIADRNQGDLSSGSQLGRGFAEPTADIWIRKKRIVDVARRCPSLSERSHRVMRSGRRGFTLIELLVGIAILAILAAILVPVFAQARDKARQATCVNTLKQISLAIHMYGQDYDETLFPYRTDARNPYQADPLVSNNAKAKTFFNQLLEPYVKNVGVWKCP